jgi:hypothetical protein
MENDLHNARPIEPGNQQYRAPQPTYAPFLLALGTTMLFWGLTTSPIMSAAGFGIFAGALGMWIRDIAKSWRNQP